MGTIQTQNLSFTYPGADHPLFDHLSVNLDDHWKLGLIGRNGRGKTTFLKLLLGQLEAHGAVHASVPFTYFPSDQPQGHATVMQVLTATGAPEWRASVELARIGLDTLDPQRPFASLSGGEQTRVLLARGFVNDRDFPLIDEPTNHLDIAGRQLVGRYLRQKRGFICVSHDESFLNSFVDHVMSLNRSSVDLVAGTVDAWKADKAHRDHRAAAQNQQLQADIHRLTTRTNVQRQWAEHREAQSSDAASRRSAAKLMRRAKAFEDRTQAAVAKRQGLLQDVDQSGELTTSLQTGQGHRLLVSLRQVTIQRDHQPLFSPVDLDFHQGDRLAILGANGCGKTSLIQVLLGQIDLPHTGYLLNQLPVDVAVLAQDFSTPIRQLTPADWGDAQERTRVWNLMHQLGVSRERLRAPAAQWSMGEAKKAALARTLSHPHALVVWDEPTNYLDIAAREQLITLIQTVQPTLIIIDHDQHFLTATCSQQLALQPAAEH